MSTALVLVAAPADAPAVNRLDGLRQSVLNGVSAENSKRNYALALDELSAFCMERQQGISRTLILEFRAALLDRELSPSTINVKLSAIRKLVDEAKRAGFIDAEQASQMSDVPNVAQRGARLGNWLTKEQARELLAVPDRSTIKGLRDYVILSLLVGCALRRRELASLTIEDIQMRENRWVIADLRGKGGRIRTVAVPVWVKLGINAWQAAAKIEGGPLLRSLNKVGKVGETLSDWAIWSVVTESAKDRSGSSASARMTCAVPVRSSAGKPAAISNR